MNAVLLLSGASLASDPTEQTVDPLPTSATFLVQPQYGFPHGQTRFQSEVLFQPTLPFPGFFVPGLPWGQFRSVVRVQIVVASVQIGNRYAGGFADLQFVDVAVHTLGPFDLGAGVSTIYPMATDPMLGAGQWQVGPAMAATLHSIRHVLIGAAVEFLWSVAGDDQRPSLGYANVQPIALLNLPAALSLFSNAQMTFAWRGAATNIPLNLGIGRTFSEHFAAQVQGAYGVSGAQQGNIGVLLGLTFQR